MNVRIISPYTDDLDITLIEENPSVESINNDFILLENYEYEIQIYLECFDDIENIELFIGDIAVPLNFNISSGCYQTNRGTLFSDAFDLVKFSLLIEDIYGYETIYHSKYIRVATSKQTLEQVEKMISEIEVDLPNFIEACFSSHFRESGLEKNKSHSISSVISIVNEIIDIYEEQYAFFSNQRKSKVISIPSIVDLRDMEYLNQDSLSWIVNNPDMLIKSNATHGIKFDDENYIPLKIKTYISKYSSDIYENQIVLGFLKLVFRYLNKIIDIFKEKLECLIQVPEKILSQIPEGYGLTDRCIHFYYSQIIKLFGNQYEKIRDLYYRYKSVLICNSIEIISVPKFTNTFKRIYQYRICYEIIVKWFYYGDYSFSHFNHLIKLKKLSKIFEYYCLIRLCKALKESNFNFISSERIVHDIESEDGTINNKYIFEQGESKLILFYEPNIWTDKLSDGITLYSTGYNFSKMIYNDYWKPDFIIKLLVDNKEYYYILDAKFTKKRNIKKFYISDLILKYGNQIASINKNYSDIVGIGAIYPSSVSSYEQYRKNKINSIKLPFPQYFSIGISVNQEENDNFHEIMRNILDKILLVDDNETRSVSFPAADKYSKDIVKREKIDKYKQENKELKNINRVFGKNCFYNGRNLCLLLKRPCNISGKPCDLFVAKNERVLLDKSPNCRHFRILNRRKTSRANNNFCNFTRLQGCIGEECQFLIKIKEKR